MSEKSTCRLAGAIRLTDSASAIGIPVYTHHRDNHLYISETDYDLRITRFLEFLDDDKYRIDYALSPSVAGRPFVIGDHIEIPYWIEGGAQSLSGGISLNDFDDAFGLQLQAGSVLADLRLIVERSRQQFYQGLLAEHEAASLQQEYGDVFSRPPVHSKYWVSRYRSAALRCEKLTGPSSQHARRMLRERALAWIDRFRTKSDLRLLMSLLQSSSGALKPEEVRLILFRYLQAKTALEDWAFLKRREVQEIAEQEFPHGLFRFYVEEAGVIRRAVRYGDMGNTHDFITEEIEQDFVSSFIRVLRDYGFGEDAFLLSMIFFGQSDLPLEISDIVYRAHAELAKRIQEKIVVSFREKFRRRSSDDEWREAAEDILTDIADLHYRDRMLRRERHADPNAHNQRRALIDKEILAELRKYAGIGKRKKR